MTVGTSVTAVGEPAANERAIAAEPRGSTTTTLVTVDTCRIDLASFRFSTFKGVVFTDCKLIQADFQDADLRGARFERCDLTSAQFSKAQMEGTRFADCNLSGIGGVTSLKGAIVKSRDALALTYSLASALGITIEDG